MGCNIGYAHIAAARRCLERLPDGNIHLGRNVTARSQKHQLSSVGGGQTNFCIIAHMLVIIRPKIHIISSVSFLPLDFKTASVYFHGRDFILSKFLCIVFFYCEHITFRFTDADIIVVHIIRDANAVNSVQRNLFFHNQLRSTVDILCPIKVLSSHAVHQYAAQSHRKYA